MSVSQWCDIAASKADAILGCIKRSRMASTREVMAPFLCCGHTTPRIAYMAWALYENLNTWEFAQRRTTRKIKRTETTSQVVNLEEDSRENKRAAFKYLVLLITRCVLFNYKMSESRMYLLAP